ncbi:unnamed protein product [Mytilus coruscus]|uniref:Ig-like domain-containing protein n=1 Tax=Mytilus coruscus TaxID=42192 RepID=A0A6J8E6H1_MYTCO|nr:unnamed protein product [Mytilus coruscus]
MFQTRYKKNEIMYLNRFLLILTMFVLVVSSETEPGTCVIEKKSCSAEKCKLQLTAYCMERVSAVQWYHGRKRIDNVKNTHYTGSLNETMVRCSSQIPCVRAVMTLVMAPFLPRDYGMYRCVLTTPSKKIRCESNFTLKLSNPIVTGNGDSGSIQVKTNFIYIAIGVVAGCGLMIVILLIAVIKLARGRRQRRAMEREMNVQNNRKESAGQSHHTYASIGSDIGHYESLSGRRCTNEGYDIPGPAVSIKKDSEGYLKPETHGRLSEPEEPELQDDEFSDFTMDSAFSSSTFSFAQEDIEAYNNRKYSAASNQNIDPTYTVENIRRKSSMALSNPEYTAGVFQKSKSQKAGGTVKGSQRGQGSARRKEESCDYQNIKKTRRLT